MSAIPTAQRQLVAARDGGCVACGMAPYDIHHRQRRREGGHDVANLVALCRDHHRDAHAHPAQARLWGLIVPTWASYATTPIWHAPTASWRLLDDVGGWAAVA